MTPAATSFRVALLQTDPRPGLVDANLAELHDQLRQVADADLAVAPELATHGYDVGAWGSAPSLPASDERLSELGKHGPAVVTGFAESWRHHRYNSGALIDESGVRVQRKLFLVNYRMWEERKHFRPGNRMCCFDVRGTRIAVLVCNDLWHPPLPWLAVHGGAEIVVTIANSVDSESSIPVQRTWELLTTHTAVTLQSYVVFVNRAGTEGGDRFWGGSAAFGPDGTPLTRLGTTPEATVVDIDLDALRVLRREWPLLQESRYELITRETQRFAAEET